MSKEGMWEYSPWDTLDALLLNHVGRRLQGKQPSWGWGSNLLWYAAVAQAVTSPRASSDRLAGKAKAFAFPMGHFFTVKDVLQHRSIQLLV